MIESTGHVFRLAKVNRTEMANRKTKERGRWAAQNKKREQGSRTPNVVFYKCNYNKLITIVKGDFWGRKAFFKCPSAGVAGEERPASRHGGLAEGGPYKSEREGRAQAVEAKGIRHAVQGGGTA